MQLSERLKQIYSLPEEEQEAAANSGPVRDELLELYLNEPGTEEHLKQISNLYWWTPSETLRQIEIFKEGRESVSGDNGNGSPPQHGKDGREEAESREIIGEFTWDDFQKNYHKYHDLAARLRAASLLPESDRKGNVSLKESLFTGLVDTPITERNLPLDNIVTILGMTFEDCKAEFLEYEQRTKAKRKAAKYKPSPVKKQEPEAQPAEELLPLTTCIAGIEPKAVDWLWPDFIPVGGGTLFSGDPGGGKTFFLLDMAARLTRGTKWADGSPVSKPANVLYLSFEDDPATTLRPRFDGLGGDVSRFHVLDASHSIGIDLADTLWLTRLEAEVLRIGDVRLVILDPIIDFSESTNPNKAEEVRALLTPLVGVAARLGFALVLVGHLNKSESMSAIYRAGGSTSGWLGKCRAGFIIFRDADDRTLRHLSALKANLAHRDPPQLEFRLSEGQVLVNVSVEYVSPDEHLNPKRFKMPREKDNALEWLKSLFDDRTEIPATEIFEQGEEKGFSERTLKRAKAEGGFISKRGDSGSGWVWMKLSGEVKHGQ
ncbi:MAG: AAA family ATPase [Chrysiogenia bacterium]